MYDKWFLRYKHYIQSAGYKKSTVKGKEINIRTFLDYLMKKEIDDIRDVTEKDIHGYVDYLENLYSRRKGEENLLSDKTKFMMIKDMQQFFKILYWKQCLIKNPASHLEYKIKCRKVRPIIGQEEMQMLLDNIHDAHTCGKRDRALFELIYSSALRAGDAAKLKIGAVDFETRIAHIKKSKFGKDRFVPLTVKATEALKKYLGSQIKNKEAYVFHGYKEGHIGVDCINTRFKYWAKRVKVYKKGLCAYSLRHAAATHLLENGAGIRYVQELLGHESIETTVIYTKQLYASLKRVYKRYHPRENEYYKEVDSDYLESIRVLEEKLNIRNEKTRKDRKYMKKSF
jgi:integrase/recombinase XerD